MIHTFSFSNYRSYFNLSSINFEAKKLSEYSESLIRGIDGTNLLPVCAIYGPNGGGKSSVLLALKSLTKRVIVPMLQVRMMRDAEQNEDNNPFNALNASTDNEMQSYYRLNDEGAGTPTTFSIVFSSNGKMFMYNLDCIDETILKEELLASIGDSDDTIEVFSRTVEDGLSVYDDLEGVDLNINKNIPILSYIAAIKDNEYVDDAMRFFLETRFVDYDITRKERHIDFGYIEKNKAMFIEIISSLGSSICDFKLDKDTDGKIKEVYSVRKTSDGSEYQINFRQESSGTVKLFSVLAMILSTIREKSTLFVIDELDAKLHPMLLQKIIEMFTNKNMNISGSQILFTSHDLTTMSNHVFRRDEIWFAAINEENQSVLYSMIDLRDDQGNIPRKDEVYNRRYLQGRYGADPYLRKINDWEGIAHVEETD